MFRLRLKQTLSVFMAALMVQSSTTWAASSAAVVGSINSYGAVSVGKSPAPASSTLLSGDTVTTQSGNAVVRYEQGTRVMLASTSAAVFSPRAVELKKGQMILSTTSSTDVVFNATSLRLEPTSDKTSAEVSLEEGKATIAVREGSVRAVDPSGKPLAVISAGEAKLFAMASPAASAAAAPAAPAASASAPPVAAGLTWILVGTFAVAGTTFGIYRAVTQDHEDLVKVRELSPIR
jgi:ferric-dicitrate binding protein FerR (iron transport regulator)